MTRLHKFFCLSMTDRGLLGRTTVLLWGIRLGLWLLPFQNMRRILARVAHPISRIYKADQSSPDRIAWAIAVASGYVPKATCLCQAFAVKVLLERQGIPACLYIGVARGEERRLEAHAWVESQGKVVIGGSRLDHYTPLPALEVERP